MVFISTVHAPIKQYFMVKFCFVELGSTPTETLAYTNENNVFVSLLFYAKTLLGSTNAELRTTYKSVNVVSAETV